jgi:hypothetical protein
LANRAEDFFILYREGRSLPASHHRLKGTAPMRRLRDALDEVFNLVTPLELSLVFSTLAVMFLVAAKHHGELM